MFWLIDLWWVFGEVVIIIDIVASLIIEPTIIIIVIPILIILLFHLIERMLTPQCDVIISHSVIIIISKAIPH